jgi:hypothetical protein
LFNLFEYENKFKKNKKIIIIGSIGTGGKLVRGRIEASIIYNK